MSNPIRLLEAEYPWDDLVRSCPLDDVRRLQPVSYMRLPGKIDGMLRRHPQIQEALERCRWLWERVSCLECPLASGMETRVLSFQKWEEILSFAFNVGKVEVSDRWEGSVYLECGRGVVFLDVDSRR